MCKQALSTYLMEKMLRLNKSSYFFLCLVSSLPCQKMTFPSPIASIFVDFVKYGVFWWRCENGGIWGWGISRFMEKVVGIGVMESKFHWVGFLCELMVEENEFGKKRIGWKWGKSGFSASVPFLTFQDPWRSPPFHGKCHMCNLGRWAFIMNF